MGDWRQRISGAFSILLIGILLGGCAKGIAEFQLYTQAFDGQYEQGQVVLDRVARAERIVVGRHLGRASTTSSFNPNDAAYYLDTGDPPITASIRASLKSLKDYNDALGALASGEAAEALTARAGTLSVALFGAAGALATATGGAALVTGAPQLIGGANAAVNQALPIVQRVATHASRDAFRKQLVEAYPAMRDLMLALRDGTPAMFEIMKRSYVRRGSLETPSGISASDMALLEKDRQMLAGWVVLMDKSLAAMEVAVTTALSSASPADLATLTAASVELQVLAAQVHDIRRTP